MLELPHEAVEAAGMRRGQAQVLVQIEGGHPRQIEPLLAMEADQLAVHPERGAPGGQSEGDRRLIADAVGHDAGRFAIERGGVGNQHDQHREEGESAREGRRAAQGR